MAMDSLIMTKYIALSLSIFMQLATAPGGGGGGGVGGGGGGSSSYSSSSYSSSSSGKNHDRNVALTLGCTFLGICCIVLFVTRDIIWDFIRNGCKCKKGMKDENYTQPPTISEWLQSEETSKEEVDQPGNTVFIDGEYVGRYQQYGIMHDFPPFQLNFANSGFEVWGSGFEEVGQYNMFGKYNPVNNRMAITQKFVLGTGNPSENLGHSVIIRLEWNANAQEFEGKWYCKTHKYAGVNKFWIKPAASLQSVEIESTPPPNFEDTMGHKYV